MMQPFAEFETGARVIRPDASIFDLAFGRIGVVIRETIDGRELKGVEWEGSPVAFEYPDDIMFERCEEPE